MQKNVPFSFLHMYVCVGFATTYFCLIKYFVSCQRIFFCLFSVVTTR